MQRGDAGVSGTLVLVVSLGKEAEWNMEKSRCVGNSLGFGRKKERKKCERVSVGSSCGLTIAWFKRTTGKQSYRN